MNQKDRRQPDRERCGYSKKAGLTLAPEWRAFELYWAERREETQAMLAAWRRARGLLAPAERAQEAEERLWREPWHRDVPRIRLDVHSTLVYVLAGGSFEIARHYLFQCIANIADLRPSRRARDAQADPQA